MVVHCASRRQAEYLREAIGGRLKECQLEMNPDKTRIVYCKDDRRQGAHQHISYEFLGYQFRARRVKGNDGRFFNGFNPAMGPNEAKRIHETIRSWRLGRWTIKTLDELATWVNPRVQGWINYYGHFYKSVLLPILRGLNEHLARWARRKYKRLSGSRAQAYEFLRRVAAESPNLFAHWRFGMKP